MMIHMAPMSEVPDECFTGTDIPINSFWRLSKGPTGVAGEEARVTRLVGELVVTAEATVLADNRTAAPTLAGANMPRPSEEDISAAASGLGELLAGNSSGPVEKIDLLAA